MKDQNIPEVEVNFYKTVRKKLPSVSKKTIMNIIKREIHNSELKEINIIVVGRDRIRNINREFLKKNRITDVISFNLGETGEIYICKDFVKDERDYIGLIFHGFAHIMGYDHKNDRESSTMSLYENHLIMNYFKRR